MWCKNLSPVWCPTTRRNHCRSGQAGNPGQTDRKRKTSPVKVVNPHMCKWGIEKNWKTQRPDQWWFVCWFVQCCHLFFLKQNSMINAWKRLKSLSQNVLGETKIWKYPVNHKRNKYVRRSTRTSIFWLHMNIYIYLNIYIYRYINSNFFYKNTSLPVPNLLAGKSGALGLIIIFFFACWILYCQRSQPTVLFGWNSQMDK